MKRRAFLSLAGAAPLALVRPVATAGTRQLAREADVVVIGGDPAAFSAVYGLAQDPALRVVFLQDAPPWLGTATVPVPEALADVPPFVRGHRLCFDGWRARGNTGWGYDDVLPFFKRVETYEAGASAVRGGDGPLSVAHCWDPHAAHRGFLMGCAMSGFQQDSRHDFNGPRSQGIAGYYQKAIRDDRPHTLADAFLAPLAGAASVEVRAAVQATRIVIERGRAVGVEYLTGGHREIVRAGRSVVLCSGTARAAQLLMLSGVGPADALRALGVPVMADRPGVGGNLHDQVRLPLRWQTTGTWPASSVTAGMFTVSLSASPPDLQMDFTLPRDGTAPAIGLDVTLVRPTTRGTLTLRSANPGEAPAVAAGLIDTDADLTALVQGVRLGRLIMATSALERWRGAETDAGVSAEPLDVLRAFVRRSSTPRGHLAGSCAMGPADDPLAVVDASLRVHGVDGLRMAGAAVMPDIVNAPPEAAALMIGDRCAELIREGPGRA